MGAIGWMIAAGGSIIVSLICALVRTEISVWHDPLIKFLIRRAASKAPGDQRVAIEAELLSWIGDVRSPTMKVMQSLSLFFSANRFWAAGPSSDQKVAIGFFEVQVAMGLAAIASASFGIILLRSTNKNGLYDLLLMMDRGGTVFYVPHESFWFSRAALLGGIQVLAYIVRGRIKRRGKTSRATRH
jgi:hypothetical protein